MKKLISIIICLLMLFCFAGCKDSGAENEKKPVELVSRSITDKYEFALVDDSGEEWLQNEDVENVLVMYYQGENRYVELRFTKDGTKKFKKAVKSNKNGILSITLDGGVIMSGVIANPKNSDYAKLTGEYDNVIDWFNKITKIENT